MFLVLTLRADHPLDPAYRFPIRPDQTLVLGRGPEVLAVSSDPTTLRVTVPDLAVSRQHVELRPDPSSGLRMIVRDLDSTNGLLVQGLPMVHGSLQPGELLEVGSCLFVLCAAPAAQRDEPGCVAFASTTDPELEAAIAGFSGDAAPVALVGEVGAGAQCLAEDLHLRRRVPGPFVVWKLAGEPLEQAQARAQAGTVFVPDLEALTWAARCELARAVELPSGPRLVIGAQKGDALCELGLAGMGLFARSIRVPPIAERRHDLGRLLGRALASAARRQGRNPHAIELSRSAARVLLAHRWPGGFAELQAAIDCALGAMTGTVVRLDDLPSWLRRALGDAPWSAAPPSETAPILIQPSVACLQSGSPAERASTLRALLAVFGGNVSELARWVGRSRRQVHRWIRDAAIDVDAIRDLPDF